MSCDCGFRHRSVITHRPACGALNHGNGATLEEAVEDLREAARMVSYEDGLPARLKLTIENLLKYL